MTQIQEIEATIVGASVVSAHPELHHYTNKAGFEGIIRSNELWATHFADLNDSSEIVFLRSRMEAELYERFRTILKRGRTANLKINRVIAETGGLNKSAESLASDLVRSLYASAIAGEDLSELSDTAGSPFIASLCSHTHEPYERDHGLLSQWRGYGGESGFCLVFDTARFAKMLGDEFDSAAFTHLNMSAVHYAIDGVKIADLFPNLISSCDQFVASALRRKPILGNGIEQFFAASTLLKHPAFLEEREVRIVGIPMSHRMRALVKEEHPEAALSAHKLTYPEAPTPGQKRHIKLFEGGKDSLPLRRVIVGPSAMQGQQVEWARALCGPEVPIMASATPFKG